MLRQHLACFACRHSCPTTHERLALLFGSPKASTKRKPAGKTAAQVAQDRARFAANVEAQKAAIDAEADAMMKALEAGVDENFDSWDPVRAP